MVFYSDTLNRRSALSESTRLFFSREIHTVDYPILKALAAFKRFKLWQKEYAFSDPLLQGQKG